MLGESLRRRHGPDRPARMPSPRRPTRSLPGSWPQWLGIGVGVVASAFGAGYGIATLLLFPAPDAADGGLAMPDLAGTPRAEAVALIDSLGLVLEAIDELTVADAREDRVVAQSPVAGQQLRAGAGVQLAIGVPSRRVVVPDVRGLSARQANALLQELGFDVDERRRTSAEPVGRVLGTQPDPGTRRDLPATVMLSVSAGLPEPIAPRPGIGLDTISPGIRLPRIRPPDTTTNDRRRPDADGSASPSRVPSGSDGPGTSPGG